MALESKNVDIKAVRNIPANECRKKLAELSKGIAHPARVEIVSMLSNRPPNAKCVCGDIVDALPLAQSTVSQHLKILKETGWVRGEIDRPHVCYCLVDGVVAFYQELMTHCIEKNSASSTAVESQPM